MLRKPSASTCSKVVRVEIASMAFVGLIALFSLIALAAGPAAACTAADASLASTEGLKLRLPQGGTVLSAYVPPPSMLAQARPSLRDSPSGQVAEPDRKTTGAQSSPNLPSSEPSESHAIQPLAMLAAALVLMVSIALRRSGKR